MGQSDKKLHYIFSHFFATIITFKFVKYSILKRIRSVVDKTQIKLDDLLINVIKKIGWPFYIFFAIYIAINFIQIPEIISLFFTYTTPILIVIIIVRSLQQFVEFRLRKIERNKQTMQVQPLMYLERY
jgi:hypothetical protein